MKKRGRPPKPNQIRMEHRIQIYGDAHCAPLLEAIARRRGSLTQSATIRLLIYEEATRLGIRVEDLRAQKETISEREPELAGVG